MMANTIAARKREPGEMVMVSLATAVPPSCSMPILNRCAAYRTAPEDACTSYERWRPSPRLSSRACGPRNYMKISQSQAIIHDGSERRD